MIPMPIRHTMAETVTRAASQCLRLACQRHFPSVSIGQVASVVSGGTPSTSNPTYWDGDIVWVTPKDLGRPRNIEISDSDRHITQSALDCSSATLLPAGAILLSSRAPIGHVAIAAVPLCTNQGFKNVVCSSLINNRYLFHILRASIGDLESLGRGNTFLEIPARIVKDFLVPLPPIDTQCAIARFLDSLYLRLSVDSDMLPELPHPLTAERRTVLRIVELAGKIEEAQGLRREATKRISSAKKSILDEAYTACASRYGISRFEDLCTSITDGNHYTPSFAPEGVKFIFVGNVSSGHLHFEGCKFVSAEYYASLDKKRKPEPGDILYSAVGATLGIPALVDCGEKFCFQRHVAIIKPDRERMDSRFVWHMLGSEKLFREAWSRTTGSAQPTVSLGAIKAFPIPTPPMVEQRRIVAHLDGLLLKVGVVASLQTETAAELDALLPSILDRAFREEL